MSKNSLIVIVFAVLVVIGGGVLLFMNSSDSNENTATTSNSQTATQESSESSNAPVNNQAASDVAGPITTEQVALHNSPTDCWTIIEGSVYDITSYIPRHQGGNNILSACGTDATAFFNGQQAGQAGGTNNHSSNARSTLASFKIGEIN